MHKLLKIGHEINPDFKIGCMIAYVPIYPYSCNPEDMMLSVEAMHDRYFFGDVHCSGSLSKLCIKRIGKEKDIILRWKQEMQKS